MTNTGGFPELRVLGTRLYLGCSAGLAERTAVVDIGWDGELTFDAAVEDRVRKGALALCPEEPLRLVAESDWPTAFLIESQRNLDSGLAAADWLGRWLVAVTVGIQRWAHDPVWRGAVVATSPNRITLAIPWYRETVFAESLELALRLVAQWSRSALPPSFELNAHFGDRWAPMQADGLSPYTLGFIQAGVERGLPFEILPSSAQIGWGAGAERFDMTFTNETSWIAAALAKNKSKASRTMAAAGLPVPASRVVGDVDQAVAAATELGWPVVIKPLDQELGRGVVAGIPNESTLREVFDQTAQYSRQAVVLERFIPGNDHRMLVIRGVFLTATRRIPAGVTGDGERTVSQLVEEVNTDPRRGTVRFSVLKRLTLDSEATSCLADQGLGIDSVPDAGQWVVLQRAANVARGGTALDVTAAVHPDNAIVAERAARVVGLDIAGIDFITTDISRSWREIGGGICEINAQPELVRGELLKASLPGSQRWDPAALAAANRDVEGEALDLFFEGRTPRIPTAAIIGIGAGATARNLAEIWRAEGKFTGVCTSSETRIGDELIGSRELAGYRGARIVLDDPGVEAAVFEITRENVAGSGHPCDRYDVVALLDGQDLRGSDAETLSRAAHAVVVNADDPLCARLRSSASRRVLVSRHTTGSTVAAHRGAGGEAVSVAESDGESWIVLTSGESVSLLTPVAEIRGDVFDAMCAAALAWAQGIDPLVIRQGLSGRNRL